MDSEQKITASKTWIQKLKEESWQAEILISTIAIYGSLQLYGQIDSFASLVIDYLPPGEYTKGYLIVSFGVIAVCVLTTMFIIHFLLRTYWIGLVGLNSVFPDYSMNESPYSKQFTSRMLSLLPKLEKTIQEIDDLSSVIFSAAFFVLLTTGYLSLVSGLIIYVYTLLPPQMKPYAVFLIVPFIIGIVLQTLFAIIGNFKVLKSINSVQLAYYKITKWVLMLLYGPLYKYLTQISMIFGTNFKKRKSMVVLILAFLVIGMVVAFFKISNGSVLYLGKQETFFDKAQMYRGYYGSTAEKGTFLLSPQIDSDIIESNATRLFIPIYQYEKRMYKNTCGKLNVASLKKEQKEWTLDCYSTYHEVFLNGKRVATNYLKYEMSGTGQFGIITYLEMSEAKRGKNILKVIKKLENKLEWELPFYHVPE